MKDAVIISDIHLGSDNCEAKLLNGFLENIQHRTKKLILNGDVFDSIDMRRLKKHHWHVLSNLRKISDQIEVIWISGNHDGPAEIISHLLGIEVVEDYQFVSGNKEILVFHGDQFDTFLNDHPILTWVGDTLYWFLQKIDQSHYIARMAKHSSKHYLHNNEKVMLGAVAEAEKKNCQVVCCGHTHHPMFLEQKISYYNSGSWTEKPCSYIEIEAGRVCLVFAKEVKTADDRSGFQA